MVADDLHRAVIDGGPLLGFEHELVGHRIRCQGARRRPGENQQQGEGQEEAAEGSLHHSMSLRWRAVQPPDD